jgi:hypothetical protein
MVSNGITFILHFMKIGHLVKMFKGEGKKERDRQYGDLIILLPFLKKGK